MRVAYVSRTGNTETVAGLVAESARRAGHATELTKIVKMGNQHAWAGCDGCIFSCPTYRKDLTTSRKSLLFVVEKANVVGKMGGARGSSPHSGESA